MRRIIQDKRAHSRCAETACIKGCAQAQWQHNRCADSRQFVHLHSPHKYTRNAFLQHAYPEDASEAGHDNMQSQKYVSTRSAKLCLYYSKI